MRPDHFAILDLLSSILIMMCVNKPFGMALVIGALLIASAAGCDLFTRDAPEEVRLLLEGTAQAQVLLVTTNNFLAERQGIFDEDGIRQGDTTLVRLFTAETLFVSLPFEQTYDIRRTQRFFALALRLDPSADDLRMRAWVDERNRFDQQPTSVPEDSLLRFIYFFSGSSRASSEPPEV